MKTQNAIKKLTAAGFKVTGVVAGFTRASNGKREIAWLDQDGEAFYFCDYGNNYAYANLTQALTQP